ncbi:MULTISPECIES: hypothetical protein [unclassified Streptomyces]|uniref:hypothetical protein n=1 Tax=unclassified Streptomyces TaxID=2593676 RepID=UPI002DD7B1A6|nr:hypothetical protein [Streptomyces sp. NBC_00243]WRZ20967.1 hypothetical protein OHT59_21885 [Streptomyces sp. NBC_00243]
MSGSDHAAAVPGTRESDEPLAPWHAKAASPARWITTAPEGLAALLGHVDRVT